MEEGEGGGGGRALAQPSSTMLVLQVAACPALLQDGRLWAPHRTHPHRRIPPHPPPLHPPPLSAFSSLKPHRTALKPAALRAGHSTPFHAH